MTKLQRTAKYFAIVFTMATEHFLSVNAFAISANRRTSNHQLSMSSFIGTRRPYNNIRNENSIAMSFGEGNIDACLTLALPFLGTSLVVPAGTTSMVQSSPNVDVEVLNNMAHLTMDVCTFFVQDTCVCRVLEVSGRVLAMAADYAPDHAILGDEFVFQMIMLGIATKGLVSSLLPKAAAIFAVISQKDIRAHLSLFRKTGLTWTQYRTLKALAFEWVDVKPGQIITSDEQSSMDYNIYYLYSGEVNVESQGKHLHKIHQEYTAPRLNDVQSMTLFGETGFVRRICCSNHRVSSLSSAKTTTKAGPKGATLLSIDTSKLAMLMDNDANLAQSIRCLLMNGMQDKMLSVLCTNKSNQQEKSKA